jgi:hypothetical protein
MRFLELDYNLTGLSLVLGATPSRHFQGYGPAAPALLPLDFVFIISLTTSSSISAGSSSQTLSLYSDATLRRLLLSMRFPPATLLSSLLVFVFSRLKPASGSSNEKATGPQRGCSLLVRFHLRSSTGPNGKSSLEPRSINVFAWEIFLSPPSLQILNGRPESKSTQLLLFERGVSKIKGDKRGLRHHYALRLRRCASHQRGFQGVKKRSFYRDINPLLT